MKKYLYIYKSELMSSIQYVGNVLLGSIGYVIHIFVFFYLWNYMYDDPSALINGYSKTQMIWYVILTEIIWSATASRKLCSNISNDVRGGNIAYNMNKPYSYVGYSLSNHLGEVTLKGLITTCVGCILGMIFLHSFPTMNILSIALVIISCTLAIIINSLLTMCIGLLSFYIEDATPVQWIYGKIMLLLGTIFPIEFFPAFLQSIIKFSPIFVTCYGPARMFVNFEVKSALIIIAAQIVYLIVAWLLCNFIYKKGVKKLNVNGG